MKYKLYAQRVFCYNWQDCLDFYQTQLKLPLRFIDDGLAWAEFEVGDAVIALECIAYDDIEAADLVGRFVGLSLQVENMTLAYQTLLEAGVEFTQAPKWQDWGGTLAHFKDPANNILTLVAGDLSA